MRRLFRWKAIIPLGLFLGLLVVFWAFYVDRVVERVIELVGTEIVGAKVELGSARVRLFRADVVLTDLQVTNPQATMTDIVRMDEIVADLRFVPLLEKKAVVETLAVRGMRFNTPRATSGAVENPSPTTGLVTRRVLGWANSIPIPSLNLSGLGEVARFAGISADSLRAPAQARALAAAGDSMRGAWERQLREIDPGPTLDSARALAERLRGTDIRSLGVTGARDAATSARAVLQQVGSARERLASLQRQVDSGVAVARRGVAELERARQADYAWARGLIRVPSLATPDVSMAVFGEMAVGRLQPLLYWTGLVEQYIPEGMRRREAPGPARVRMAGTTYTWPKERTWPRFLLEHGDASLYLGGQSAATGAYTAWASGVTNEPAVYGAPLRFAAQRTAAATGPERLRVGGSIDRVGSVPRDSVELLIGGVGLPPIPIRAAGARLEPGRGTVDLSFVRDGGTISGRFHLVSDSVSWVRESAPTDSAPRLGSREWVEALLWRSISAVRGVEVDVRFSGRADAPTLQVSSNVGDVVAAALRREVGAEIARAEARVRAEVDRLVAQPVADARSRVTALESGVRARLASQQQQLQEAQAELERRVRELGQVVPGVWLPSLPRIRPD